METGSLHFLAAIRDDERIVITRLCNYSEAVQKNIVSGRSKESAGDVIFSGVYRRVNHLIL
jgi:hypothetical protein